MIDPHSRYVAFAHEIEHQRVHRRKYFGILYPDCSQIVDIEEATVVDLVSGNTPETQAIRLIGEHALQCIKAARVAFASVHVVQRGTQTDPGCLAAFHQLCQSSLEKA